MAVYMYQLDNRFCSRTFVYENDCQSLCHEHRCQETHNVAFSQIHGLDKKKLFDVNIELCMGMSPTYTWWNILLSLIMVLQIV